MPPQELGIGVQLEGIPEGIPGQGNSGKEFRGQGKEFRGGIPGGGIPGNSGGNSGDRGIPGTGGIPGTVYLIDDRPVRA
jgi:hypothetical protein